MIPRPYFKRIRPNPQDPSWFAFSDPDNRIDLRVKHLPPYPEPDSSGAMPDSRRLANDLFDNRAAAAVSAAVGDPGAVRVRPQSGNLDPNALLEWKDYEGKAPNVFIMTPKALAAMAYGDYFPGSEHAGPLRAMVSDAIMTAGPGWCGVFGPDVSDLGKSKFEGNYDFAQMFILPLAYSYYDDLTPAAQENLIQLLLTRGRVHRANLDDILTSGGAPNDWSRAGYVSLGVKLHDIPETENHVLMIATARYLTNQLLYQRDHDLNHDNRRNGNPDAGRPSCLEQVVGLLRNYLRDDFAEYNAKNYQEETRHALLNLCSYAYDPEVRLGARMVLDYISGHIAVSSNDLRRMVPFRRRNETQNKRRTLGDAGFLDVGLLDGSAYGPDPMPAQFALLAGNTRAYEKPNHRIEPGDTQARPWEWAITPNFGTELVLGATGTYRLPPSIHDLFVNDLHRRFFQRLHRHPMEEPGGQRNCDNMEIYAGSPSYLITAGGQPADHAIPGGFWEIGAQDQDLGVAVPTSFMPTGRSAGGYGTLQRLAEQTGMAIRPVSLKALAQALHFPVPLSLGDLLGPNTNKTVDLIQLCPVSDAPYLERLDQPGFSENYGVAPDFACGYYFHLPAWTGVPPDQDGLFFVDRKSRGGEPAGFFLAILKAGNFGLMEAFDTWLHPEIQFEQFRSHVSADNPNFHFQDNQEMIYTSFFGNKIHFVIWGDDWNHPARDNFHEGAKILGIEYGSGALNDTLADAGNDTDPSLFLSGTVLKSPVDGVVEIHNPFLGTRVALDWSDPAHLVRISEDGSVEEAGGNHQIWVDFDWQESSEGDFYRPYNTLSTALDAVAEGGIIHIMNGTTRERLTISKRVWLTAPGRSVTIGSQA